MSCNRPLPAWRNKTPNDNGRYGVTFRFAEADTSRKLEIPCGRCTGCRLERARAWAVRMCHEAKLYRHNYFITLTYNEASLPRTVQGLPTLRPEDFTLFMKRLRKYRETQWGGAPAPSPYPLTQDKETPTDKRIRYYQCGEYGETTNRPHHHAILFNCYLPDLKPIRLTRARNAHTLYESARLAKIWTNGMVSVGQVTFETAAYVAAYVTKKITGTPAAQHYNGRVPEYSTMSRRPGIGAAFHAKYAEEIWASDSVIIRGHEMRPPKFYDRTLERTDPELYYEIRDQRANTPKHIAKHREREAKEVTSTQQLRKRDAT
ncbi:MAG: replication initiator protein [Microvirus sp.]|nr:MAG: replication initiator protein [Microvirus sp.]